MGHVVVHRDAQGSWQVEDIASLGAALERVETLRNVEQRDEVRLFDEIALEVRTYYRVALADERAAGGDEVASSPQPPAPVASVAPVAAVEEPDASGGPGDGDGDDAATLVARTAAPAGAAQASQSGWDPGSSPSPGGGSGPAEGSGNEPDSWGEAAAATPPPGTFPLAAPPVPAAVGAEPEPDREHSAAGGRRGPRFTRDR